MDSKWEAIFSIVFIIVIGAVIIVAILASNGVI